MADAGTQAAGGPAAAGASAPSVRRRRLWLWVAGVGCGLLTLLWLVVAGACLVFWLRGPVRYRQCHEITVAFPIRDAEEVDRQIADVLADADRSMIHRTVAEDGTLTVYARSDQVAEMVKRALGSPVLKEGGARLESVRQLPELPPAPVPTIRRNLRVRVDWSRCSMLGISADELSRRLTPRLEGSRPDDAATVASMEIGMRGGAPLRLTDVATVEDANVPSHVVRDYPQDAPGSSSGGSGGR